MRNAHTNRMLVAWNYPGNNFVAKVGIYDMSPSGRTAIEAIREFYTKEEALIWLGLNCYGFKLGRRREDLEHNVKLDYDEHGLLDSIEVYETEGLESMKSWFEEIFKDIL